MQDPASLRFPESIDRIHEQLQAASKNVNIIEELRQCLSSWDYKPIHSLTSFKEDIQQVTEEIVDLFFREHLGNTILSQIVEEFIHCEIYDTVFAVMKEKCVKNDLTVYKLSREFCKNNGTPKQLGATFYNFIPNAAVVELSMLNNKKTPMEKLKCLQATFDYIFAEVKGALISVISKYSEKEIDIPLMNNKEVGPIIMSVILKSKLFYFVSDMAYIKEFGTVMINKNSDLRNILEMFEESLTKILNMNCLAEERTAEKLDSKLGVCDTINFVKTLNKEISNNQSVFNEERKRIAALITCATTENLDNYT